MKLLQLSMAAVLALPLAAAGQDQPSDSIASQLLQEVVIQAPKVIHKADMDVMYPSRSAVENSQNGMQLLRNMMIPTLSVDDIMGSITTAGQTVQVRINGRVASIENVKALLPESIKRVEWIDNPGLRYNGANAVLNFIVENPTVGGSIMASARPALNQKFGFYMANAKLNVGRSQWQIGGNFKLTKDIKAYRDYKETFTYPNGSSLTRTESPLGGNINNSMGSAYMSYSYIKPDTTTIYVELLAGRDFNDLYKYEGLLTMSDGSDNVRLTNSEGSQGSTPTLSAYFEQHFAGRQTLVVDLKSSFYDGKTFSNYLEQSTGSDAYLTDINTMIRDHNWVYAVETDYIKNWSKSRLTAGASYTANRNRSVYDNLDGEVYHQRQNKAYLFAEYFQRINKVTLTAGIGAQYTEFLFKETNQGNHSWNLRPQATATYSLNQHHNFRLNFTSWQTAPSLSETNIAPQQIDGFQWRIGNPNLKTSNSYKLSFRYAANFDRVAGLLGVNAYSSPNAITPLLMWEGDRLVTTYENSQGLQNLSFYIAPQIEIISDWLMASGYLQYRSERMRGTGYKLYNHGWSGDASVQVIHWGFVLSGSFRRAQRDLFGEKLSWGEDINTIDLSYNWNNWQFCVGVIMPFGKYDQGSKLLSKWNTNEQHMRMNMRIPYIGVSYNLKWGHQKHGANKLINANGEVDKSSAAGR